MHDQIAATLVKMRPDIGCAEELSDRIATLAGPGLAPESQYRERVEKRRKARWKRAERHILYREILPRLHAQLDAELRGERRAEQAARRRGL